MNRNHMAKGFNVLLLFSAGCLAHTPEERATEIRLDSLAACPAATVSTAGWERAHSQVAPVSFLLPPGARREGVQRDGHARAQAWHHPSGLIVSQSAGSPGARGPARDGAVECVEIVDGTAVWVRMFYAEDTYVPGYYLSAVWTGDRRREMRLRLIAPDSARRDELLAILRSLRFHDPR